MKPIAWLEPRSVEAAVDALADESTTAKAGGIDLMDLLKERLVAPERLVNLRGLEGLDGIEEHDDGVHVGALATLAQIAEDDRIATGHRALAEAAGHAATPQIRNVATIGGNLLQRPRCWYFRSEHFHCRKKGGSTCYAQQGRNAYHAIFDNQACAAVHPSATAAALVALGAKLELATPEGPRERDVAELFVSPEEDIEREHDLGPAEIITSIVLPPASDRRSSAYAKQGEKASFDWPLAEVAVALETKGDRVEHASVILGAAAPVPYRAAQAEEVLAGKPASEKVARWAAKVAVQGATPLSDNGYKLAMFETLVRRTILAAGRPA